jgi:hypothetical protein
MEKNNAPPDYKRLDPLLILLMDLSEQLATQKPDAPRVSITLNVGGLLVSGTLINKESYLKEIYKGAIWKALEKQTNEQEREPKNERLYIHLKNSRFYLPGQPPIPRDGDGVLWRGKLSSVDGFILGQLEVQTKPDA